MLNYGRYREEEEEYKKRERGGREGEGGTEFVISYFILQSLPC
jgi:hypothetical protein